MNFEEFATHADASVAAASQIAAALQRRLNSEARTQLVVTGGSSPAQCYAELAQTDLAWKDVQILLSDERWVPADHPDSNEKLVRETLLIGGAAAAELTPFYDADMSAAERSDFFSRVVSGSESPLACSLLGMGSDGHFASLFPDADNLSVGLAMHSPVYCLPVNTLASSHQRISLTLSAFLKSDEIVLLMFGDAKRDVLEQASEDVGDFPVASLLNQSQVPVNVFWAP